MTDVRKEPQAQANPAEAERISGAPQLDQPVRIDQMPPIDYVRPRETEQPAVDTPPTADRKTGMFLNLFNTRAKRIRWGVGSAATGAAALAVGLMLPKGDNGSTPVVPDFPDQTNSSTFTPSPTPEQTQAPTPETGVDAEVAAIQIEAGLPDAEYAQTVQERLSDWHMAGAKELPSALQKHVVETGDASDEAINQFIRTYATEQTNLRVKALFGTELSNITDQSTLTYINAQTDILYVNLQVYLATYENAVPFNATDDFEAFRAGPTTETGRSIDIDNVINWNTDESSQSKAILEERGIVDSDGAKGTNIITTRVDGQTEYINTIKTVLR